LLFRGLHEHALDTKHRLTVPSSFRAGLAGGAVIAASPEIDEQTPRCVSIWRPEDYEKFVEQTLAQLNPSSPTARQLERFFFNNSIETELDSANRLMIPNNLLRYGSLVKDVTVAGSGRCIEVWDRQRYEDYQEGVLTRIPELTASLGETA
jgi:MraZ protein